VQSTATLPRRQVHAGAAAAAAKLCDVVSYNLYRRSLTDFRFHGNADVPLLVGEFSFGALDRGLFHPGFVAAPDQQRRARAYENYVQTALQHPQFVGTHWFQYQDEPTTGRVYDEEKGGTYDQEPNRLGGTQGFAPNRSESARQCTPSRPVWHFRVWLGMKPSQICRAELKDNG
jgi:hypothetical protein